MSKAKLFFIKVIVLFLIGISSLFVYNKFFHAEKIHYHAGFVVFENNQKITFSDFKYMYLKPCLADGKEDTENENRQMEKAHLHDNVGDVVHVEEQGAKWQDLFSNISYPIDYTRVTAYINNQKVPDLQKLPINPDDSLVVFIGENDPKFLTEGVTKEYIEEQAKKSTTCGD